MPLTTAPAHRKDVTTGPDDHQGRETMTDYQYLSDTTETSIEILRAIAEHVGDDEARVLAEWQNPADAAGYIARACEMTDEPLYWGASGRIV